MPLILYSPEDWTQLLSAQKSSICKRRSKAEGNGHQGCGSECGCRDCLCQQENRRKGDPKSAKYCVLAASFATHSKNVNIIAAHMGANTGEDDNVKRAVDGKMASNAKNSFFSKNPKKERE